MHSPQRFPMMCLTRSSIHICRNSDFFYKYVSDLKVGSWSFEGTIILLILFSKLSESTFYKEISKFQ